MLLKRSALSALVLSFALLGCGTGGSGSDADSNADSAAAAGNPAAESAEALTPEAAAAEAQARAEWEAQMKQIQSVLSTMDREALIAESATKGPKDAEIVLLKFSDFQCPYCAVASADMKVFTENHPDDVLYVYKQLPLESIHPEAMPSAKAAWAAGQQDTFWLYHDGLFAYQDKLSDPYYEDLAAQVGLDLEQFNRDRTSPEAQAAIEKDIALAQAFGIRGTPTFVMNDLLIPGGAPLAFFDEAVTRLKAGAPTQ